MPPLPARSVTAPRWPAPSPRSGRAADEHFTKYQPETDPAPPGKIAAATVPPAPDGTQVLAGLETGGIAVVTALSLRSGLPCAFVRKASKPYGTARLAEGAEVRGRRVLVIEDVAMLSARVSSRSALAAWMSMRKQSSPVSR
jgi:orotate phosphoribosyltransferase